MGCRCSGLSEGYCTTNKYLLGRNSCEYSACCSLTLTFESLLRFTDVDDETTNLQRRMSPSNVATSTSVTRTQRTESSSFPMQHLRDIDCLGSQNFSEKGQKMLEIVEVVVVEGRPRDLSWARRTDAPPTCFVCSSTNHQLCCFRFSDFSLYSQFPASLKKK